MLLCSTSYLELEFEVDFNYLPPGPDTSTEPNGDPGTPPDPEEYETLGVYVVFKEKGTTAIRLKVPDDWLPRLMPKLEEDMKLEVGQARLNFEPVGWGDE